MNTVVACQRLALRLFLLCTVSAIFAMGQGASNLSPPYYPAPYGGWAPTWSDSYTRAVTLVEAMTLAEKVNITAGTGMYMGDRCVANTGSAERVGFPQLCFQDGPLGVRTTGNITAFPAGITTGATFDKKLMYERGVALGEEFRGKGANVYLGPSVGPLGRKPRGGRNWEGFGSDPVLQGIAGAETIRGVQEQGVIATIKHLIGNEQEMYRASFWQKAYSANIGDRAMHELYLWPFADAVHAGVGSAMTAYNDVNGSSASQNSMIISGLLKDELGFQGFVMTDWLSHYAGVASALAGLDMSLPGDTFTNSIPLVGYSHWMGELSKSVLNGSVPVDRLNDMCTRIVATWFQFGQDQNYPKPNFHAWVGTAEGPLYPGAVVSPSGLVNEFVNVQGNHKAIAKQVAQEAITLVKNNNSFLPLSTSGQFTVFGTDAQADPSGINNCLDKSCNGGTLTMGWGSGSATLPYLDDPITSIRKKASKVTYHASDTFPNVGTPGDDEIALVFINSDSGENSLTVEGNHGDRDASGLAAWHNGDELVKKAAAAYKSVVVVYHTVGPVIMDPWVNLPSVKAVLVAHLPGQEAGDSLTEVLFGEVSPSGHLPYTIPVSEDQYPESLDIVEGAGVQDTYLEDLYIDYRFFNKNNTKPRYAFGHGLSYTTFEYSEPTITSVTKLTRDLPARSPKGTTPVSSMNRTIPAASEVYQPSGFSTVWRYLYSWVSNGDADNAYKIGKEGTSKYPYPDGYSSEQKPGPAAGGPNGGNPALWDTAWTLSVTVTNTGSKAGKASGQVYVQFPDGNGYDTPIIQLRDFEKTATLQPGGSEKLEFTIKRRDVSVWDVKEQTWVVPGLDSGYKLWIGDSSDNLHLFCNTAKLGCEEGVDSPV